MTSKMILWTSVEEDLNTLITTGGTEAISRISSILERSPEMKHPVGVNAVKQLNAKPLTTLLLTAVNKNNPQAIRLLMIHGADPTIKASANGFTALHVAAKQGHVEVVLDMLNLGDKAKDPQEVKRRARTKMDNGWTPLHSAADNGKVLVAKALLEHGAFVNAPMEKTKWTPIHAAAKNGNSDIFQLLLDFGADRHQKAHHRDFGQNATIAQIAKDRPNILDIYNNYKSNIAPPGVASVIETPMDTTPAPSTAAVLPKWGPDEEKAFKMIQAGEDEADNLERYLNTTQLNINAVNKEPKKDTETTLLFEAVLHKNDRIVPCLLRQGADPLWTNSRGSSVMQCAAKLGAVNIAKSFVDHLSGGNRENLAENAEIRRLMTQGNNAGWTPLHSAVDNGQLEFCQVLLEFGADPNAPMNATNWTPLHAALKRKKDKGINSKIVFLLLERGGNLKKQANHKDYGSSITPIDVARKDNFEEMARLLDIAAKQERMMNLT